MSKQLESLGIEIDAYRSPEDETVVVFVNTPGIDENAKGPLVRVYLNDDPVYENPEYPFHKDPRPAKSIQSTHFAEVVWQVGDVESLEGWKAEWSSERAAEFLQQHAKLIRDQLCSQGFGIMEDLLATWEGPDPTQEETDG